MTLLRRIRHASLAAVAAFLLAILVGPTGPERTIWQVRSHAQAAGGQTVMTEGVFREPMVAKNSISDRLVGRLRWRLLMTQHYADVDLSRQLNDSLERIAAEIAPDDSDIRFVSHVSKVQPDNIVAKQSLAGHEFWTRQHDRAAGVLERLQSMDREVAVADPLTTLPGQPTATAILIAALASVLAALTMFGIDVRATRETNHPHESFAQPIAVPASWFTVRAGPMRRRALAARAACVVVILVIFVGVATKVSLQETPMDRLIHWPLGEVADLV